MDCYYWVVRDAYLPQGSHGLKPTTKAKLRYEPIEVDPEKMVGLARENTQELAEYSISDAVATYYLYKKHIHDFIFALCTIIPMTPDEVLRKGSGTLCELLLMAEAYNRGLIFPNKKIEEAERFYQGHLISNETYIGGKVECLQCGVYRTDVKTKFNLNKIAYETLMNTIDELIEFVAQTEWNVSKLDIANYGQVYEQIYSQLQTLAKVAE
jgi:DNA polymerase epsilon subunit 1